MNRREPKKRTRYIARNRRNHAEVHQTNLDEIILAAKPAFRTFFVEEPKLVFGGNQVSVNPKTGIDQYGPHGCDLTPRVVKIGVIGTGRGIDAFQRYLDAARRPIRAGNNSRNVPHDPICFPDFPGLNENSSFRSAFVTDPGLLRSIPDEKIHIALKSSNPTSIIKDIIGLYTAEMAVLNDAEPSPDVVAIIMPDEIDGACAGGLGRQRRQSKPVLTVTQKMTRTFEREKLRTGQQFLDFTFDDSADGIETVHWNIHHALKAQCMPFDAPTQLIWQGTLSGSGLTQDPATTAWNLMTAIYYKAGNIPWQLYDAPSGTCFVGLSFYKDSPHADAMLQTSLAQVFSGQGEGLVLKGERALLDEKRDRKPHLDALGAEKTLLRALSLYEKHHQAKPARVVIHKTSRYWPDELVGFKKALGGILKYDFLTLSPTDHRFMRMGKEPPIRGTVIELAPRRAAIFTMGYVPFLGTYPGMRIPRPLEIVEHHGQSPQSIICAEIMALTKVNWNSSAFSCSDPITIRFARNVGRIMAELPSSVQPQNKYKFYM